MHQILQPRGGAVTVTIDDADPAIVYTGGWAIDGVFPEFDKYVIVCHAVVLATHDLMLPPQYDS